MNDEYSNEKSLYKTPEEIKDIIQAALVSNEILGYLNGNLLYMKSFGKDYSLDKIFAIIGMVVLLLGIELGDIFIENLHIFLPVGIGSLVISFILGKFLKFYLVYDIDREVFYTITSIFNNTVYKTNEINRRDIIEFGVDVTDKIPGNEDQVYSSAINFKGDILDNPGLRTSFSALLSNGKTVDISEPVALRKPHEAAVARCKLFADCFGVKSVICNKDESLEIVTDGHNKTLKKRSRLEDWEKQKQMYSKTIKISLGIIIIGTIVLIYLFM